LRELSSKSKVHLWWTPEHEGVEGNEKADSLAKAGASMSLVGPEPYCGVTKRKWESKISAWEAKTKASYWNNTPGQRLAKLFNKY